MMMNRLVFAIVMAASWAPPARAGTFDELSSGVRPMRPPITMLRDSGIAPLPHTPPPIANVPSAPPNPYAARAAPPPEPYYHPYPPADTPPRYRPIPRQSPVLRNQWSYGQTRSVDNPRSWQYLDNRYLWARWGNPLAPWTSSEISDWWRRRAGVQGDPGFGDYGGYNPYGPYGW